MGVTDAATAAVGRLLRAAAASAPARVFVAVGCGGRDAASGLRLDPRVEPVESPRHAALLVVAGPLPVGLVKPLLRVHDQLAGPRTTVLWEPSGDAPHVGRGRGTKPEDRFAPLLRFLPEAVRLEPGAGPEAAARSLAELHRALLHGDRQGEEIVRPDVPPARWRGVGPHGQGGQGMTGGRPYGRPMPERGPDRDGLELDRLPLRVGPFFPPLPPGLTLYPTIQGDVIQSVRTGGNPFDAARTQPDVSEGTRRPQDSPAPDASRAADVFLRALRGPVPVAALEVARARSHLLWLGEALRVHGLPAPGRRALRLAVRLDADDPATLRAVADGVEALRSRVRRWRSIAPATRGIGRLAGDDVEKGWGPIARASGKAVDARTEDPAYRRLGFRPRIREAGDAEARWHQRVDEALQSLELAERAAEEGVVREPGAPLETPRGVVGDDGGAEPGFPLGRLSDLLAGLEWGDAVATLVSLDLDLESRAALRAAAGLGPEAPGGAAVEDRMAPEHEGHG